MFSSLGSAAATWAFLATSPAAGGQQQQEQRRGGHTFADDLGEYELVDSEGEPEPIDEEEEEDGLPAVERRDSAQQQIRLALMHLLAKRVPPTSLRTGCLPCPC